MHDAIAAQSASRPGAGGEEVVRAEVSQRRRSGRTVRLGLLAAYVAVHLTATHWPDLTFAGSSLRDAAAWLPGQLSWYLHGGSYLALVVLALCALPGWRTGWRLLALLAALVAFATADEATQALVPGRTPSPIDWMFNLAGIAAGLAAFGVGRLLLAASSMRKSEARNPKSEIRWLRQRRRRSNKFE